MNKKYKTFTYEDIVIARTDENKMNEIIENYMDMVHLLAMKLFKEHKGYDLDDLLSIGTLGIYNAVQYYDDSYNTLFVTLCYKCIYTAIYTEARRLQNNYRGRGVGGENKINVEKNTISLDSYISRDTDETYVDRLQDVSVDIEKTVISNELKETIWKDAKEILTEKQFITIYLVYKRGIKQEDVAKYYNCTKQAISQKCIASLRTLGKKLDKAKYI